MKEQAAVELTPTGVLRAGINMSNFLLVTSRTVDGDPGGVSPDMARALAEALGVRLQLIPFPTPGELADAAETGAWDIGLIGAEPQRAERIEFSPPYVEIEATYLVPENSAIRSIEQVDGPGVRVAAPARSAYGLWLERNLRHATLVTDMEPAATAAGLAKGEIDALAGLRPGLLDQLDRFPGARLLDGRFTAVRQAIGVRRGDHAAAAFVRDFVEDAKRSGLVARLIAKHGVEGRLSVAPPADAED